MANPGFSLAEESNALDNNVDVQDGEASTARLTVGGDAVDKTVEVGINEVAYRKHTVDVLVTDMMDYYLVLAGDPNLTLQTSQTYTVPTVEENVQGAAMPENRWGFAWEKEGSTEASALTYRPITAGNTTLESNSSLTTGSSVNFSGQLNFAAKFGESAALGKYSSKVSLSLIATPRTVANAAQWKNTAGDPIGAGVESGTMQGVGPQFCDTNNAVKTGYTIELKDARDDNTYKIMKMPDGSCWMVENLRLGNNDSRIELTSNDTDLNGSLENWTLPASYENENPGEVWNDSGNNEAMIKTGANLGDKYKEGYGNYYSWCAATADTCMGDNDGNRQLDTAIIGAEATSSICPRGWQLPEDSGMGSFQNLYNSYPNSATVGWSTDATISYNGGTSDGYSGRLLGTNSLNALFPTAGVVNSNGLSDSGGYGRYWSRRAYSTADGAYNLSFLVNYVSPQAGSARFNGYSVRCVAKPDTGAWTTPSNTTVMTELKTMQDITKSNFSDKYCANTSAANALVPEGSTIGLMDSRDGNVYTIYKAADGHCWMGQNLSLTGPMKLTSSNSDVTSDWDLPASVGSGGANVNDINTSDTWDTDNNNVTQIRTGSTGLSGWKNGYGNYYSWRAATAGTGTTSITGADASASVCPKGWTLPSKLQLSTLISSAKSGWTTASYNDNSGVSGYYIGSTKTNLYKGANFWPAAGHVTPASGILASAGSYGHYWSRTANSNAENAHALGFNNSYINPNDGIRWYGFSVRCIAEPEK